MYKALNEKVTLQVVGADSFPSFSRAVSQWGSVDIEISELKPDAFPKQIIQGGLILLSRYLVLIEVFAQASSIQLVRPGR